MCVCLYIYIPDMKTIFFTANYNVITIITYCKKKGFGIK